MAKIKCSRLFINCYPGSFFSPSNDYWLKSPVTSFKSSFVIEPFGTTSNLTKHKTGKTLKKKLHNETLHKPGLYFKVKQNKYMTFEDPEIVRLSSKNYTISDLTKTIPETYFSSWNKYDTHKNIVICLFSVHSIYKIVTSWKLAEICEC